MKGFVDFFKKLKWYEYAYLILFNLTILVLGIIFKSSALVIISSILGILMVFFLGKGKLLGNIIGIVQGVTYIIISYFNQFYGEAIICGAVTLPIYIFAIISWAKNQNKDDRVVQVNNSITIKEILIVFAVLAVYFVGVYFMLRAFNTANLVISTISAVLGTLAGYLVIRRSEYNFICYMLNNIIAITLWLTLVITKNDLAYISTVVQYCMFFFLNLMGTINWIKIKRVQNMRRYVLKKKNEKLIMDTDYMKGEK